MSALTKRILDRCVEFDAGSNQSGLEGGVMAHTDLSAARLREILHYDPETGIFTWKVRVAIRVRIGQVAGCVNEEGYISIGIDGADYRANRLAWLYVYGAWPAGQVDHVKGVRADNRIAKLRDISHAWNQQNRQSASANTAGMTGVTPVRGRWRARVKVKGRLVSLGTHDTPELAHAAYIDAKRLHHPGNTL